MREIKLIAYYECTTIVTREHTISVPDDADLNLISDVANMTVDNWLTGLPYDSNELCQIENAETEERYYDINDGL